MTVHNVRRGLALDDAREMLAECEKGGTDFVGPRNIIAVLDTPCAPDCEICVPKPNTARCPDVTWDGMVGDPNTARWQCEERRGSESALYDHLLCDHRYPEEDAGTSAGRAWRERS